MEPDTGEQSSTQRPASAPDDDSGGRLSHVIRRSRILASDVADWVELRVQLLQMEIEKEVQRRINVVLARILVAALLGVTGLFGLITVAVGLGWWLGHPFWGYLTVTVFMMVGSAVLAYTRPQFVENPFAVGLDQDSQDSEQ